MFKNPVLTLAVGGALACAVTAFAAGPPDSSRADAAFLAMAAEADMTVAHLGRMAETNAAASEVKNLAKTLVQDHTSDYERLSVLCSKVGYKIPKGVDRQDQQTFAKLRHVEGKPFDRAFLSEQSAEHEKLINAFRREAERGTNPEIKDYASKTLPTIEQHLHDAQNLMKQHS